MENKKFKQRKVEGNNDLEIMVDFPIKVMRKLTK
jgi:hypothetical protein